MWNAQLSESSKFWTHIALPEKLGSKFDRVLLKSLSKLVVCCFWRDFNLKVIFSLLNWRLFFSLSSNLEWKGVEKKKEIFFFFSLNLLWESLTLFFSLSLNIQRGKRKKESPEKTQQKKKSIRCFFVFRLGLFFSLSGFTHLFFFWKKRSVSWHWEISQWKIFWKSTNSTVTFLLGNFCFPFFSTIVVDTKKREQNFNFFLKPRFKFDYPLNLSISLSGGKESNNDSPSNGEWTGKSSSFQPSCGFCLWYFDHCWGCGVKGNGLFERKVWLKCFGISCHGGWEPRSKLLFFFFQTFWSPFFPFRVALLESATWSGWYIPPKAQYLGKTDSKQVPWGKDEKNFEKRVKKYVKPVKGKLMSNFWSNESSCSEVYVGFFWWRFCCCFSVILFFVTDSQQNLFFHSRKSQLSSLGSLVELVFFLFLTGETRCFSD